MKLKVISVALALVAAVLVALSLARQTRATPETSPAKAPASAEPAMVGSAPVDQKIVAQLSRKITLPGKLLDAQFLQEQVGDGRLGPSDFYAFYALKVPVADVPAWKALLAKTPVVGRFGDGYAKPKTAQPWWMSEADFNTQKADALYGPENLTGWPNGWVTVLPDGHIFIYSFTM